MPTVWSFQCLHRATIETNEYFITTQKVSQEICPDCKDARGGINTAIDLKRQGTEEKLRQLHNALDLIQEKLSGQPEGSTYQFTPKDGQDLGFQPGQTPIGLIFNEAKLDEGRVKLATSLEALPQEMTHFSYTPFTEQLALAKLKVDVFEGACIAAYRTEARKEVWDQDRMQEQNRRRLEWNAIATKLLEIERNANVGATPAAAADGNVSLLVEQNFQLVMRKAARLMCPQVTLDTFFFAVDLHKWQNFQDPAVHRDIL